MAQDSMAMLFYNKKKMKTCRQRDAFLWKQEGFSLALVKCKLQSDSCFANYIFSLHHLLRRSIFHLVHFATIHQIFGVQSLMLQDTTPSIWMVEFNFSLLPSLQLSRFLFIPLLNRNGIPLYSAELFKKSKRNDTSLCVDSTFHRRLHSLIRFK